ncbi:TlpA family protein disulfide reductase [Candidatus Poriferisodalis sp.]|uniref:TlpA family protein disulfide reductase n=1 Tax=Candidatus Poriferisodalis sp. TaxID=3101277 RepID=UPI003B02E579
MRKQSWYCQTQDVMSAADGFADEARLSRHDVDPETQGCSRSWVRIGAVLVGLMAASLVALLATRDSDGGSIRAASPLIGELVPPLRGELIWPPESFLDAGGAQALPAVRIGPDEVARFDIDAAGPMSSSPRWVLVNFFASWCVPCEREHPALATWAARHSRDGVLVAVPFGDRTSDAIAFYERLGGDWSVVDDLDSRWAVEFGVLRPPESFLITPDGIVAARWQGQISADDPDDVIALLLGAASGDAAPAPGP